MEFFDFCIGLTGSSIGLIYYIGELGRVLVSSAIGFAIWYNIYAIHCRYSGFGTRTPLSCLTL